MTNEQEQKKVNALEVMWAGLELAPDDRPVCEKCGGNRFETMRPVIDGVEREYVVQTSCACMDEKLEEQRKREAEAVAKNKAFGEAMRTDQLRDQCFRNNERYRKHRFKRDDSPKSEASRKARKYVENWDKFKYTGAGVMFFGNVGTGKSFYACCIANGIIDRGCEVVVTTIGDVLNHDINDRDRRLKWLASRDLLVIDDLGMERMTDYAQEFMFTLIDERDKSGMPLIVTTNLSPKQMMEEQSLVYQRIFDRVLRQCPIRIGMDGQSRRRRDDPMRVKAALALLEE